MRACRRSRVPGSLTLRPSPLLARLVSQRGAPAYLHSNSGPKFVSAAILKWLTEAGIGTAQIESWQNGTAESFNG